MPRLQDIERFKLDLAALSHEAEVLERWGEKPEGIAPPPEGPRMSAAGMQAGLSHPARSDAVARRLGTRRRFIDRLVKLLCWAATAIGLLAAIPAVMAYNYFTSKIRVFQVEMENFSIDFLNIMKRHFFRE